MSRGSRIAVVRAFGRVTSRLWLAAGALAAAAALVAPASALAGTGEPCKAYYLTPKQLCYNTAGHHSSYIETESWNSNGTGHGSCTGVLGIGGKGEVNIKEIHCRANEDGYDEVYCTTKCNGLEGYAFVWNEVKNASASYFTAWADWR